MITKVYFYTVETKSHDKACCF